MIVSWLIGLGSMVRRANGDCKMDGKVVDNLWNSRVSIDYLHFMKFEAMQFNW